MMKNISIIGGGFSAWLLATIFAKKNFSVNIFEGKRKDFGSQQISPNGWLALTQIIDIDVIKPLFEPLNTIHIKKINTQEILELVTNYDLINNVEAYGSISRENLIKILKNKALSKKRIKKFTSTIDHIIPNKHNKELIDSERRVFETDFVIGADGVHGVSRKFVVGSNKHVTFKKIFRAVSVDNNSYHLTKRTLQILLHSQGYFVIYPTIMNQKKATNYIFVPSNNNFVPPQITSKSLLYLIPNNLNWITTLVPNNTNEKTSIFRKDVFLFGEAAFPTVPHLAQGGNQILEDAVFLKNFLDNNDNLDEMVRSFVQNRYLKRNMVSNKSEIIGQVLNSNKLTKYIRDFLIQSKGKDLINNTLNEVWTS
jgi:2-polyprenyl-6-methoxyphenol hydroxylase-like FAD-dependent oxidoreductase